MERDITSELSPDNALDQQAITSDITTVGEIIDTAGFEGLDMNVRSGVITDGSYTTIIEDGDESNLSDAAPVSSDLIIGTLPAFIASEDNVTKHFGSVSKKRFQRISIVSTGTTSGGFFSATAVKGKPRSAPTS